ncbi:MAG: methylmalonyl Co-A mutase-associated GTPase MeaB [Myxococcota bacterium]|nr:methylmalonyl Co-A mutase-associated GTPase MeaB [Myxococcota bacterium]
MTRDPITLAEQARNGQQAAGARLIRMLEEGDDGALAGLRALLPHAGRAHWIGVTGPPGAGKSTLVDGIVGEYRRRGRRVGVIAVDPSSPFSGGAILGDRVRMQSHATDPDVFIRSMATRGQLGGLARVSFEASTVLDAMGYDVVLIETVGVGQDEVDVVELAHTTAVVSIPGMGDDIQAIKAGILEVGDLFIVNKADLPGADRVVKQLTAMLHLREAAVDGWATPIVKTEAESAHGIAELVDVFEAHRVHLEASGGRERNSIRRAERVFRDVLGERAAARLLAAAPEGGDAVLAALRNGELDPYAAVDAVLGEDETADSD